MPDKRLIDANALLDAMPKNDEMLSLDVRRVICDAPTIDAVPVVHARWVYEQRYGDSGRWVWRCSACRREAVSPIISALTYCHSCGAKMDGGAEK